MTDSPFQICISRGELRITCKIEQLIPFLLAGNKRKKAIKNNAEPQLTIGETA